MFCDSDDTYEQNMCEIMLEAIQNHKTDLIICSANLIVTNNRPDIFGDNYIQSLYPGYLQFSPNIIPRINAFLWNKIFKKELVDKYNIRFPDGHVHDDMAFVFQYSFIAKDAFILSDKLYNYHFRENSVMDNYYKNLRVQDFTDIIYVIEFLYKFLCKQNKSQIYKSSIATHFITHLINAYTFIDKNQTYILLKTASDFVNLVGEKYLCNIQNKTLLSALLKREYQIAQNELYNILKIRKSKYIKQTEYNNKKAIELSQIIDNIEKTEGI